MLVVSTAAIVAAGATIAADRPIRADLLEMRSIIDNPEEKRSSILSV